MSIFASRIFVAACKATVLYVLKEKMPFKTLYVVVMWKSICSLVNPKFVLSIIARGSSGQSNHISRCFEFPFVSPLCSVCF